MDVEGWATISANAPTTKLSQRRPQESPTPKFCDKFEDTGGNPFSGDVHSQDIAVNEVLDHTLVTLHGIKATSAAVEGLVLGPTTATPILVQGTPAEALLDTEFTVTIISLDFLVKALTCEKEHCDNQIIREEVKRHLEPTALKLGS